MKRKVTLLLLLLSALLPRAGWGSALEAMQADGFHPIPPEGWEKINHRHGVDVFAKKIPGSKLLAFRGETVIDAPVEKIYSVLVSTDPAFRLEWVDRLIDTANLEIDSDHEGTIYHLFDLPWPIADRDYVLHIKGYRDRETGRVYLVLRSVDHPNDPGTRGVRAITTFTGYELIPLSPEKTRVSVEVLTDPRGLIPSWLVNLVQKTWPSDTLHGLSRQVEKTGFRIVGLPPAY